MLKRSNETQPDGNRHSGTEQVTGSNMVAKLAVAETCSKWTRCGAAYCPALGLGIGGKHYEGERVCSYLLEAVKEGGQARVRACVASPLAEAVVKDVLRLRNSTGPLKKALERASKRESRMVFMQRAAKFRGQCHD